MPQKTTGYQPSDEVMADATDGDVIELSQYVSEVEVIRRWTQLSGVVLHVQGTSPQASATYRLRAVDDDDGRLLLEKQAGKNWTPHVRVEAALKS